MKNTYRLILNSRQLFIVGMLLAIISGCATFQPVPIDKLSFMERAQTKTQDGVTVNVAVLSADESEQAFGAPLADKGIQPVWLHIENMNDSKYLLLENKIDRNYYSPHEAAWKSHYFAAAGANRSMNQYFHDQHIPLVIEPQQTVSGFVYTNLDEGLKYVNVDLAREGQYNSFWFVLEVPGLEADYKRVDFERLYTEDEIIYFEDDDAFRNWLEEMPCCVLGGDKETLGDPLNLVVIGHTGMVIPGFSSRGWDLTETMHWGAIWRTIKSSLFGERYRTSPVSPLYLFGREQDFALQKARSKVDERNHLRLWLAPVQYKGMNVLAGQISRDIGIRLSSKTFVTHKIDPVVDEARNYLGLDLFVSGHVAAYGFVEGVVPATFNEPRYNYTKDPYYTDGRRLILIMADEWTDILDIDRLDWMPILTPQDQ